MPLTNKYTAIYRCPDEISQLKVLIRIEDVGTADETTRIFGWQQKYFNKAEKEFFSDERNCVSDQQKSYHKDIKNLANDSDLLYSYTQNDHFLPENELPNLLHNKQSNRLGNCETFDYKTFLEHNLKNPVDIPEVESMYLLADFGDYVEDIWIKDETVLCSLKYDLNNKVLRICPDFTNTEPYVLKIQSKTFQYYIENVSDQRSEDVLQKELILLKKVENYKNSIKNQMIPGFHLFPKNKLKIFIFFEILSAGNFEDNPLFVQYTINLPTKWRCEGDTDGMTSLCYSKKNFANFGHDFDLVFDYELENFSKNTTIEPPCVYFEILSKDYWDRYRTEGLTYKILPISQPGNHVERLHCWRFGGRELRRFFIGDYGNYPDVTSAGIPREFEGKILNKIALKTVSTGELNIRYNIVHQSQALMSDHSENFQQEKHIFDKLNSSNLMKSVEQVLTDFRKARKNMLKARGDL